MSFNSLKGFTTIELLICLALTAALFAGFTLGLRRFVQVNQVEQAKNATLIRHSEISRLLKSDLSQATDITGYSKADFVSAYRLPESDFNSDDIFDNINLWIEEYGQFEARVKLINDETNKTLTLYYILENASDPSPLDQFVTLALNNRSYFFISNYRWRNLVEKSGNVAAAACPSSLTIDNSRQCLNVLIDRSSSNFKSSDFDGYDNSLRVAMQVFYEVNPNTHKLYRLLNNEAESPASLLGQGISTFQVAYTFKASGNELAPALPLRSPLDLTYQASCKLPGKSCVAFSDMEKVIVSLDYDLGLPSAANTTGTQTAFDSSSGNLVYHGTLQQLRGVQDLGLGRLVSSGSISGNCLSLLQARCNPACSNLFTSSNPQDPYYSAWGDINSDQCVCATSSSGAIVDIWNGAAMDADAPYYAIDPDSSHARLNACFRVLGCPLWMTYSAVNDSSGRSTNRYPACRVLYCLYPSFNDVGLLSPYLTNKTPDLTKIKQAMTTPAGTGTFNANDLLCANIGASQCDFYAWELFNFSGSEPTVWEDKCKCQLINTDGFGAISWANPDFVWEWAIRFDKVCNTDTVRSGAPVSCSNTYDSTNGAYKIQDRNSNPQGLSPLMAATCACINQSNYQITSGSSFTSASVGNFNYDFRIPDPNALVTMPSPPYTTYGSLISMTANYEVEDSSGNLTSYNNVNCAQSVCGALYPPAGKGTMACLLGDPAVASNIAGPDWSPDGLPQATSAVVSKYWQYRWVCDPAVYGIPSYTYQGQTEILQLRLLVTGQTDPANIPTWCGGTASSSSPNPSPSGSGAPGVLPPLPSASPPPGAVGGT